MYDLDFFINAQSAKQAMSFNKETGKENKLFRGVCSLTKRIKTKIVSDKTTEAEFKKISLEQWEK